MRNEGKRFLSLLMALVMVCSLAVPSAFAAEEDSPAGESAGETAETGSAGEEETGEEDSAVSGEEEDEVPVEDAEVPVEEPVSGEETAPEAANIKAGVVTLNSAQTDRDGKSWTIGGSPTYSSYLINIFADHERNTEGGLLEFLSEQLPLKGTLDGEEVTVTAQWQWHHPTYSSPSCQPFSPQGNYNWYCYLFKAKSFTLESGEPVQVDVQDLLASVRVIPLHAKVSDFAEPNMAVRRSAIEALHSDDWDSLGLPDKVWVNYESASWWSGKEYPGRTDQYLITAWKTEAGATLTHENLQALAKTVDSVKLTPVYAAAGEGGPAGWVTMKGNNYNTTDKDVYHTLTLSFTDKTPVSIRVNKPGDITYGDSLSEPTAGQTEIDGGTDSNGRIIFTYVGEGNTVYGPSADKPKDAGQYRVIATLDSETHSGSRVSDVFTISRKTVNSNDITAQFKSLGTVLDKVYDGRTTDYDRKLEEIKIAEKVEGDDLYVMADVGFYTSDGKSADSSAGINKYVSIYFELGGTDRGNYVLNPKHEYYSGVYTSATAAITPKPLEIIDDSTVTVSKAKDGTKNPGLLGGTLKIGGLVNPYYDKVEIDMSQVTVGEYPDSSPGTGKTVTLSNITLTGPGCQNYTIDPTYEFHRAEITEKAWPELNKDFVVTIPENSDYDGKPCIAEFTSRNSNLGHETIKYAKLSEDGKYEDPVEGPPVSAGTYKVLVFFEGNDNFAVIDGNNAIKAGEFTIRRITGEVSTTIRYPVAAAEGQIHYFGELGLDEAMTQGAKSKEMEGKTHTESQNRIVYLVNESEGGSVVKRAYTWVGTDYFRLELKEERTANAQQSFDVDLESDNYETLTVHVTVKITEDSLQFVPPTVTVKEPGKFPFGTSLYGIIQLEGGSATLNGNTIAGSFTPKPETAYTYTGSGPSGVYFPGTYTANSFQILFSSSGEGGYKNVDVPFTADITFTIEKLVVTTEKLTKDDYYYRTGHYTTIYANDDANKSTSALTNLVASRSLAYTCSFSPMGSAYCAASWSMDDEKDFDPRGRGEQEWYSFSGDLSVKVPDTSGSSYGNYLSDQYVRIDPDIKKPQAFVKVLPVLTMQKPFETPAAVKSKNDISSLGSNWLTASGLPTEVPVDYRASVPGSGYKAPENKPYAVAGWKMEDGRELTLNLLKTEAGKVSAGKDVTLRLTPVYASAAQGGPPVWATWQEAEKPVFTLTITDKHPVKVDVEPPAGITFGEKLGDPKVTQTAIGHDTDDSGTYSYLYEGLDGTVYCNAEPPVNAGKYRVSATLVSDTHSGTGISEPFTIARVATASCTADITVPAGSAGEWTIGLDKLGLDAGMSLGLKIREKPNPVSAGVITEVACEPGDSSFTLKMGDVANGKSQSFRLPLTSDNYERLEVTVTVTVINPQFAFTQPTAKVNGSSFPYGTPLSKIITLTDGSALLNGETIDGEFTVEEPERPYGAGTHTETVKILFISTNGVYREEVGSVEVSFTIGKAPVTAFSSDEEFAHSTYSITILANNKYNTSAAELEKLVGEIKGTYKALCADDTVDLNAKWTWDAGNPAFRPDGWRENVWYTFTAKLSLDNYDVQITPAPKAQVRVIPVSPNALAFPDGDKAETFKLKVDALTGSNWSELGLPDKVNVNYEEASGTDAVVKENIDKAKEYNAQYGVKPNSCQITGWRMDGQTLTPSALKTKAANLSAGGSMNVTLTPVVSGAPGNLTPPAFTLTITAEIPIPEEWKDDTKTGILGLSSSSGVIVAGIQWNGGPVSSATVYAGCYDSTGRLTSIQAVQVSLTNGLNTVLINAPGIPGGGSVRLFLASDSIPLCGAWSNQQASGPR